jgi:hypothetical protein
MGFDVDSATQCRSAGAGGSHFGFGIDVIRVLRGGKTLKNRLVAMLLPVYEIHFNREIRFPEGGVLWVDFF